jgi:hypothetical protein
MCPVRGNNDGKDNYSDRFVIGCTRWKLETSTIPFCTTYVQFKRPLKSWDCDLTCKTFLSLCATRDLSMWICFFCWCLSCLVYLCYSLQLVLRRTCALLILRREGSQLPRTMPSRLLMRMTRLRMVWLSSAHKMTVKSASAQSLYLLSEV